MKFLFVALGSALGGSLRYYLSLLVPAARGFPLATLTINVLGSFAIGIFSGALSRFAPSFPAEMVRLLLVVGFCGGFTTFSTFSNETFKLIASSQYSIAALYVTLSILAGLTAVFVGYLISK